MGKQHLDHLTPPPGVIHRIEQCRITRMRLNIYTRPTLKESLSEIRVPFLSGKMQRSHTRSILQIRIQPIVEESPQLQQISFYHSAMQIRPPKRIQRFSTLALHIDDSYFPKDLQCDSCRDYSATR